MSFDRSTDKLLGMLILAVNIGTIIFIVIIAASVISSIAKQIKEGQQREQARTRRDQRRIESGDEVPSLEEMAAKRRAQLQELAQRRGQSQTPRQQQSPNVLVQPQQPAPPKPQQAAPPAPVSVAMQQTQRAEALRRRAEQARQLKQQKRDARLRAQQQAQQKAQQKSQQIRTARRTKPPAPPAGPEVQGHRHKAGDATVHRLLTDTAKSAPAQEPAVLLPEIGATLNAESLRQAIILKELLDPPLAYRESQQSWNQF